MAIWNKKALLASLLASGAVAFAGCGSDDGDDTDTGPDAGDDIGGDTDTGNDTINPGDVDPDATQCVRPADCGQGQTCVEGVCQPVTTLQPCSAPLRPCEADSQSTDRFLCDTQAGLCRQRCADADTEDSQGRNCGVGSFCLGTSGPTVTDPSTGTVFDGVCIPGDCDSNIFDANQCEGVTPTGGDAACTSDTCTCFPVANGASFCIPAGTQLAGQTCGRTEAAGPTDSCAAGLLCAQGFCVEPCNLASGATACDSVTNTYCVDGAECTCNPVFDTTPRNQPGLCAQSCSPFSSDECAAGYVCQPQWGRFGINDWYCGLERVETVPGPGEACDTTVGTFGSCPEGYLCLTPEEGAQAVCTQICDPLGEAPGALASCGGQVAGDTIIELTSFGAASAYFEAAAGAYGVQVRAAGGALVVSPNIEIVLDEARSIVAALDEDGDLTLIPLTDRFADDELPSNGVRGIHAAGDAGAVDIYVGTGVQGLEYGAFTGGLLRDAGDVTVSVQVDGSTAIGPVALTLEAGTITTAIAVTVDGAPSAVAHTTDAPAVGGSSSFLRLFHGAQSFGTVSVYINCTFEEPEGSDEPTAPACGAETRIATLGYAQTTGLNYLSVVPGDYSVLIVDESGADPVVVTTVELTLAAGLAYTAWAFEDGTDLEIGLQNDTVFPTASGDDAVLTALHAISTVGSVDLVIEAGAASTGLAFGEQLGGDDSSWVALSPGMYNVAIRAAGAAATSEPVLETGLFELDGDLVTIVAAGLASDESLTAFLFEDAPASPATGNGAVRLLHAAAGVGGVFVTLPGDSGQVCAPSAINGMGFCNESCEPYPRTGGGGYDCESEGDACIPIVTRRDRPVLPVGVCSADTGTVAAFGSCSTVGQLGGDCRDFAACLADTEAAVTGECLPLCEPFSAQENACASGTCSGVPPLLGQLNFSFCLEDAQPGNAFDRCDEPGLPCAQDGTLCIATTQGGQATCLPICRAGFDDCSGFAGNRTCRTGQLNPEVVPTFMGLCQ